MIGIVGGTGPEGIGLAARFAQIGEAVIIGSRDPARAEEAAARVRSRVPGATITGADNGGATAADLVFVTVPYSAQENTLRQLADHLTDKVVITAVVPMRFEKGRAIGVHLDEGSAAEQAQAILPHSRVVSAFQNLSAGHLIDVEHEMDADVIVCGNDKDARTTVMAIASRIPGVRGVDGGPISYSHYVEEITVLLVGINRRYKVESQVRITGLPVE